MAMDELELLKKDWQKKGAELPKLSYDEIYKMILKKSSSIVKWIFYISIIEFIFWLALNALPIGDDNMTWSENKFSMAIIYVLEISSYIILFYFIYRFYRNYRRISTTDSARDLMKNIVRVRKTVMTYVWISMGMLALTFILVSIDTIFFDPNYSDISETISNSGHPVLKWAIVIALLLVLILVFAGLLWLFYRLIYGILLKRLKTNYSELRNLDV